MPQHVLKGFAVPGLAARRPEAGTEIAARAKAAADDDIAQLLRDGRGIGRLLRYAHRAYGNALHRKLAPYGFTVTEWRHLRTLYDEDGLTPLEMSQRIGIEKASTTGVLDNLERRKLVRRVRSETDRRNVHVFLTPGGRAIRDQIIPCAVAVNRAARQGLSMDEIYTLFRLTRTIMENLERVTADAKPAAVRRR